MDKGEMRMKLGHSPVAVSGSAVAEMRRRALVESGTTILLVDSDLRIRMASGEAVNDLGARPLVGVPLLEVFDVGGDGPQLEQVVRQAHSGTDGELSVSTSAGHRSVRCVPLAGNLGPEETVALVAISDVRPGSAEIAELRARADGLETLARATRSLARSNYPDEARQAVCEAALDVAGSDIAALIELAGDGSGLVVVAASGADLDQRTTPLDHAVHAGRAISTGRAEFTGGIRGSSDHSAWPLGQVGAAACAWYPVRRTIGIRGVIAIGWRYPTAVPSDRMMDSMELLAGEAAVAIDRAAALEHLTGMARTDPLTELSNRRAWKDELSRELARAERGGQPLAIGLIDLDDLKVYNDSWGHAAGDRVLVTAAARWRRRLRLTDLLARIGGDEFAVTMPGCTLPAAVELGDQLRTALPDGVSCSIGIAEWSGAESAADLLARADQALYAAKNSGRDATFSLPTPAGPRTGRPLPSS